MPFRQHRALIWCAVVLGLATAAPAAAEDKTAISNMDLMNELAGEVAKELLDSVPPDIKLGRVILSPYGSQEEYEFIDDVFARVLTSTGRKVYASSQTIADSLLTDGEFGMTLRLEYRALNFDLSYPKIYRPFLIGGKKVKRKAVIKLRAKFVDPSDESVVWISEASRSYEDQFPHKQLPEVEAGLFAFTKPERSTTKWGRIIEPVVVSGIIIGLIYLFFSNQNDS
jgi:hypothetical protein